jgi:hypothetical protein
MSILIQQAQTAQALPFLMVDSTDHLAPKTGLTPTVTLSKNGGAFSAPAGAVTEIGSGWYKVAGNATDSGTLGPLILHATASGADPVDVQFAVVAFNPLDAVRLGITGLPNAVAGANGGLPLGDASGRTTVGSIAANAVNAAALATDAVTEIQTGLALDSTVAKDATVAKDSTVAKPGSAMTLTTGERDSIATAVEGHLINEADGQTIVNAIVGAIGNTNLDQAALVAAIRADIERTGGTLKGIATDYARRTGDYATAANISTAQAAVTALIGTPQQAGSPVTLPAGVATSDSQAAILTAIGTRMAAGTVALSSSERDALAAAFFDLANGVENGYTLRQVLRGFAGVLMGKEGTNSFRDLNDTKDRLTYTVVNGKRQSVTPNLT